jgi:primosomal protein N' (replication factor Y)
LEQDIEQFYVREAGYRESVGYPPFTRVILLRVMGKGQNEVEAGARLLFQDLSDLLGHFPGVKILGPAPATLEKLRGKFRWQILLRLEKFETVRRALGEKIPQLETRLGKGLQLQIDVDPVGVF